MKKKIEKGKGIFISFEGPECAGKTTQIALLSEYLRSKKISVITTREPGGTEIGEQIRKIVKHLTGPDAVVDEAELLLFAASRAQHVKTFIKPALEQGVTVITDRFMDSTTAYQGYARGIDISFVKQLNSFATIGLIPDITFILDLLPEEIEKRASKRQETLFVEDRIESEKIDFHRRVREGFLRIAQEEPERVKVIDAMQEIEAVKSQIIKELNNAFDRI
ncbi:MAG TPA: dTMP kinase [Victivallales bacterium]|nr:dTMP kinase [Victivallales bacterium]HPO91246.1 dTMP kinase [Victivallales bacterium]HRR29590.1 dTMP kinase [Victivallales bacterium]HRU00473.1 dTMP kinase [Victivallales bacterium]